MCDSYLKYYDEVMGSCQMCQDVCKTVDIFCMQNCKEYVASVLLAPKESTSKVSSIIDVLDNDSNGVSYSPEHIWIAVAAATGSVAAIAVVIAVVVAIVYYRADQNRQNKKSQSSDDSELLATESYKVHQVQDRDAYKADIESTKVTVHAPQTCSDTSLQSVHYTSSDAMKSLDSSRNSNYTHSANKLRMVENCIQTRLINYYEKDETKSRGYMKEGYEVAGPDVCLLRSGDEQDERERGGNLLSLICNPESERDRDNQAPSNLTSGTDRNDEMISWLNRLDWVLQYAEGKNGVFDVAIDRSKISNSEAQNYLMELSHKIDRKFKYKIIEPAQGRFVPCPGQRNNTTISDSFIISPGAQLFSDQIEPDQHQKSPQKGYALFSGTVSQPGTLLRYGLTVAHLFEKEEIDCKFRGKSIGKCRRKISDVILGDRLGRVTADLGLIQLEPDCCPVQNIVYIEGRSYGLNLYCGKLNLRKQGEIDVIMLSQEGEVKHGKIISTTYTMKRQGINNTLAVVDCTNPEAKINGSGDSGALIMSPPNAWLSEHYNTPRAPSPPGQLEYLTVYGMVLGYYESEDRLLTRTIASRLGDILLVQDEFFGSNDVNFVPVDESYMVDERFECDIHHELHDRYNVEVTSESEYDAHNLYDSAYATGYE